MICKHCNKEVICSCKERWICITQNRTSSTHVDSHFEEGRDHYHLECFIEIAGEDYVPVKYREVKSKILGQICNEVSGIELEELDKAYSKRLIEEYRSYVGTKK